MTTTGQILQALHRFFILFSLLALCGLAACVDTGGGDDLGGGSTVRGFVVSFDGGTGAGVQVSVAGTDLSSTTAEDGLFVISGVPPGQQSVVFSRGDRSSSLQTDVPENSTVELRDVRVDRDGVDVNDVTVTANAPPPVENMMNPGDDDSGSSNSGPGSEDSGSGSDPDDDSMDDVSMEEEDSEDDTSGSGGTSGSG